MDCSPPGLPVPHQLPEFTQTLVHWVSDAIQPSHPLSSSCPPAFDLSHHQGLFKCVSSSHQVTKNWSSDSLQPRKPQHTRLLCPPLSPRVCSNPRHYINHLILCRPLLLLPASGSSFPVTIQGWFPLELTGLILQSPRDSQESSPATQFESINSSTLSLLYGLPTQ